LGRFGRVITISAPSAVTGRAGVVTTLATAKCDTTPALLLLSVVKPSAPVVRTRRATVVVPELVPEAEKEPPLRAAPTEGVTEGAEEPAAVTSIRTSSTSGQRRSSSSAIALGDPPAASAHWRSTAETKVINEMRQGCTDTKMHTNM
jgi:hypothetical protein